MLRSLERINKMKKVIIKNVLIQHFQSFNEKFLEFDKDTNLLLGFNGVGKTTVLSAILWCLTGNDYFNRNKFDIKPHSNGLRRDEFIPYVAVEMLVDGEPLKIVRYQKNNKNYTQVNDMALANLKDYEAFIVNKLGITIEQIKLLCNPNHVVSLDWKDLRNLVMKFIKGASDDEIANRDEFKPIAQKVKEYGIQVFHDSVKLQTKQLKNEQLPNILGRIEQQQIIIDEIGEISANAKQLKSTKKILEEKVANYKSMLNNEVEKQNTIIEAKDKLNNLLMDLQSAKSTLADIDNQGSRLKRDIDDLMDFQRARKLERFKIEDEINKAKLSYDTSKSRVLYFKSKVDELANQISVCEANKSSYKGVCQYCGQILPKELKEREQAEIDLKTQALEKEQQSYKEKYNAELKTFKKIDANIKKLEEKLKATSTKDYHKEVLKNPEIKKLTEQRKQLAADYKKQQLVVELKQKDYDVQKKIVDELPSVEHIESPSELISELQKVNEELAKVDNLNNEKNKLQSLKQEYDELSKKYNTYVLLGDMCAKFVKEKAEFTKNELKKYFKITEFITSELQKNGDERECFKLSLDGRTYEMLSTGEKVRVGLDLVIGLQKLQEVNLPLFIDQLGELSKMNDNITQQIVGCKTMQELNPSEKKKNKEMYENYMSAYSSLVLQKG